MFIRQIKKRNKPYDKEFIAHRLVESYRPAKGSWQRVILDLGTLEIPKERWKMLADAIEAKVSGQKSMFTVDQKIEKLAAHYAQMIIQRHLQQQPRAAGSKEPPEAKYETVDVHSLQNLQSRSIGGENVGLAACKR